MRHLPPSLASAGSTPHRLPALRKRPFDQGERLTDIQAIQRLFANGENGGYWPADPAYLYEDSAGTTAASVNGVAGLRYDKSNGGTAQALRNLLTYSEDFRNTADAGGTRPWSYVRVTLTPNATVAPDGTLTADLMLSTAVTNSQYVQLTRTGLTAGSHTVSIYVKAAGYDYFRLAITNGATESSYFNVANGTLGSVHVNHYNATITPVGNGWYRCSVSLTVIGTSIAFYPTLAAANNGGTITGDGISGSYLWGAQIETGASATPYQKIITGTGDLLPGNHAYQQTTANKPYLRRTPVSGKYWLDSNTANGALTATFASSLGSACTIATVGAEGVTIAENQTVGTTYNITPYNASQITRYRGDTLIINRVLTPAEKALVTRHFQRGIPNISNGAIL